MCGFARRTDAHAVMFGKRNTTSSHTQLPDHQFRAITNPRYFFLDFSFKILEIQSEVIPIIALLIATNTWLPPLPPNTCCPPVASPLGLDELVSEGPGIPSGSPQAASGFYPEVGPGSWLPSLYLPRGPQAALPPGKEGGGRYHISTL